MSDEERVAVQVPHPRDLRQIVSSLISNVMILTEPCTQGLPRPDSPSGWRGWTRDSWRRRPLPAGLSHPSQHLRSKDELKTYLEDEESNSLQVIRESLMRLTPSTGVWLQQDDEEDNNSREISHHTSSVWSASHVSPATAKIILFFRVELPETSYKLN